MYDHLSEIAIRMEQQNRPHLEGVLPRRPSLTRRAVSTVGSVVLATVGRARRARVIQAARTAVSVPSRSDLARAALDQRGGDHVTTRR